MAPTVVATPEVVNLLAPPPPGDDPAVPPAEALDLLAPLPAGEAPQEEVAAGE